MKTIFIISIAAMFSFAFVIKPETNASSQAHLLSIPEPDHRDSIDKALQQIDNKIDIVMEKAKRNHEAAQKAASRKPKTVTVVKKIYVPVAASTAKSRTLVPESVPSISRIAPASSPNVPDTCIVICEEIEKPTIRQRINNTINHIFKKKQR